MSQTIKMSREQLRLDIVKKKGWTETHGTGRNMWGLAPWSEATGPRSKVPHYLNEMGDAWELWEEMRKEGTAVAALLCQAIKMRDCDWRTVYAVEAVMLHLTEEIVCLVWYEWKTGTRIELEDTL